MSKYRDLRQKDGPARTFLKRTAEYHDRSMEHPFMLSIYDKKVTDDGYVLYLRLLLAVFEVLEAPATMAVLPPLLLDSRLHRVEAIRRDLIELQTTPHAAKPCHSPALDRYMSELLSTARILDPAQVVCHHFLHYNAILSGGMFLGSCLRKMGKPTMLYSFDLLTDTGHPIPTHQYVKQYMQKLDTVVCHESLEVMVQTMCRVYELTEQFMSEAQALQPHVVRDLTSEGVMPPNPEAFDRMLSIGELHAHNGEGSQSIYISIGGRVLDVTGSASYAPGGPYHIFAGHEIGRALAEMSLNECDLDDLEYTCDESCTSWASKLGRTYPPVGTLRDFSQSRRLPIELFRFDPKAPKLGREPDDQSGGQPQKCPMTGEQGISCPLGFGKEGECPFPFIFLHDPARGWKLHAREAKLSMSVLIVCLVASWLKLLMRN